MSEPLSQAGISIFYVSTFETDFLLIPEGDLPKALDVLKKKFTVDDSVSTTTSSTILNEFQNSIFCPQTPDIATDAHEAPFHLRHPMRVHSDRLQLVSLPPESLSSLGTIVLRLIFHPDDRSRNFFACASLENRVSLVVRAVERRLLEEGGAQVNAYKEDFVRLYVDTTMLGFGTKSQISSYLSVDHSYHLR